MEYEHSVNIRISTNLDDLCQHNRDVDVHSGFTQQFIMDLEEFVVNYPKGPDFDPPVYIEVG
jgi:hypothetical protein